MNQHAVVMEYAITVGIHIKKKRDLNKFTTSQVYMLADEVSISMTMICRVLFCPFVGDLVSTVKTYMCCFYITNVKYL